MSESFDGRYVDCAIIIVTYNSARYILNLLSCLSAAAAHLTLRVIVVDNGSKDDTVTLVRSNSDAICVETHANLGYAAGINVGRMHAGQCGSLVILNPDVVLEPGSILEMFKALDDPQVGVVVPTLLDFDGRLSLSLRREPTMMTEIGDAFFAYKFRFCPALLSDLVRDPREYDYRHSVDWATGAAMLISSSCDRVVGPWDESFFLYMEEVDYAARVRNAGLSVLYIPEARARHLGGGSSQSPRLVALMALSRVRYFEKHVDHPRVLRALVFLNQLLRSVKPARRTALWTVARRSSWGPLISELQGTHAATPDVSTVVA